MGVTRRWRFPTATTIAIATTIAVQGRVLGQGVSEERLRTAIDDGAEGLGASIAGGSPLTGPAGTRGGLGHFLVSAGVAATDLEFEDPQRPGGTVEFVLPAAGVRAAVGISDGIGGTGAAGGFGAVDVLGRIGIVAARDEIEDATGVIGFGARLGLLRETALSPAISVSLAGAWTEEIVYGAPDEVAFRGDLAVTSLRADLSKAFAFLSPYAGVGIDWTSMEAEYAIPAGLSTTGERVTGSTEASGSGSTLYAGLDLSLLLLTASLEGGIAGGNAFAAFAVRAGL